MGEKITKDELMAFTEVHKETSIILTKIADALSDIVLKEEKILEKLSNGIKKEIIDGIVGEGDEKTTLNAIKKDTGANRSNINMTKFFAGAIGLTVIIASVITNSIFRDLSLNDQTSVLKKYIDEQTITDRKDLKSIKDLILKHMENSEGK